MGSIFNKQTHEANMSKILMDIYRDKELASILGFKGGTACYFFYGLPRFSVDLDFDLLAENKIDIVFKKIQTIASAYGEVKDAWIKMNTILVELSYGTPDKNLKIEISGRPARIEDYEVKNLFGISVFVMKQSIICANKLIALTQRKKKVSRDVFDVWFFLKNNWPIDRITIKEKSGMNICDYLTRAASLVEENTPSNILFGLGELINSKQKDWIKKNLVSEIKSLLLITAKQYRM